MLLLDSYLIYWCIVYLTWLPNFSSALDKIVDNTTAYKDLLADIKHEYDGCINAITRGQREATFLTKKVKTYSSLPTTISGYNRRKIELQEK